MKPTKQKPPNAAEEFGTRRLIKIDEPIELKKNAQNQKRNERAELVQLSQKIDEASEPKMIELLESGIGKPKIAKEICVSVASVYNVSR